MVPVDLLHQTDLSACLAPDGQSEARLGGPLIGHKLDTGWQGRLMPETGFKSISS